MNEVGKSFVTLRMVAAAARVHASTVSLALRNDPSIPERTRRRIRAAADRLGYAPNPLFSLLMARVRKSNAGYRGTLGYVNTAPQDRNHPVNQISRNYFAGAARRAGQLGYKLDPFYPPTDGSGATAISRILRARNISGIVLAHVPSPACLDHRLQFDLTPFATVCIGVPIVDPPMHYVANDQYTRPVIAARQLLLLGYRRFGLVIADRFDAYMAHRCSAAFWALQQYGPEIGRVPILHTGHRAADGLLERWYRRHQPEVVLSQQLWVLDRLRRAERSVPRDVGFVHLDWLPDCAPAAGVYGNSEETGAAAVEMVIAQLHRGERGPPARAATQLIAGSWIDGKTVRRMGPPLDLFGTFLAAGEL